FFSWLGVTMYLSDEAVAATLELIAASPRDSALAFDYAVPRTSLEFMSRLAFDALSRRVAAAGEPLRTYLDPAGVRKRPSRLGVQSILDLGGVELNARYFSGRTDGLHVSGDLGRMMSAQL